MARVAVLGTGLMGRAFAEAMKKRGDEVTAWNRTIDRAKPLEEFGIRVVADAAEAVRGAERVHLSLNDDQSVDAVLGSVAGAIPKEAIVIDHTTTSPRGTAARFTWCDEQKIAFLHAPIFMSPTGVRNATGVMMVAGPQDRFERVRPVLEKMATDLWYVGERADKAASLKILGNAMIIVLVAGLSDVFAIARNLNMKPTEAFELFNHFKPGNVLEYRGKTMAAGDFTAAFELTMARKDLRLNLEAAQGGDVELTVLPAIAERMDTLIQQGHGGEDLGVLAIDAVRERVAG